MDKSLAIKQLRQQGLSQRAIAITLGVSRGAVIRHLADLASDDAKAPTGSESPNSTKAPTGSDTSPASSPTSRSKCEPFREVILEMLERGLDSQRIFQDLQSEHGYSGKYWSVHRFVRSLGKDQPLPFRRMEVEAGYELQVDFGAGKPCKDHTGAMRKTYIFRAVLSHSRKAKTGDTHQNLLNRHALRSDRYSKPQYRKKSKTRMRTSRSPKNRLLKPTVQPAINLPATTPRLWTTNPRRAPPPPPAPLQIFKIKHW